MGINKIEVKGKAFTLNGEDFDMWGVRVANALENDMCTSTLISALDDYIAHGVNTVSISLMGAKTGSANPFNCDGRFNRNDIGSLQYKGLGDADGIAENNPYLDRASAIISEADRRRMAVCLCVFYQVRINQLSSNEAIEEATRQVARWINHHGFANLIVDLVNEYGHPGFADRTICYGISERLSPDGAERLIELFKEVAPKVPAGISSVGYSESDVERDRHSVLKCPSQDIGFVHRVVDADSERAWLGREIPIVCNEWSGKTVPVGSPDAGRWLIDEVEKWKRAIEEMRRGGGYFFLHTRWKQDITVRGMPHFEIGPAGTQPQQNERCGIPSDHWYFDFVEKVHRR
ncbi:MAG: hypothetical protein ACUVXI_03915 [bacterium]